MSSQKQEEEVHDRWKRSELMPNIAVEHFGQFPVYQFVDDVRGGIEMFAAFLRERRRWLPDLQFADLSPMREDGIWELRFSNGECKKLRMVSHYCPFAFFEIATDVQEVIPGRDSDIFLMYQLIAVAPA